MDFSIIFCMFTRPGICSWPPRWSCWNMLKSSGSVAWSHGAGPLRKPLRRPDLGKPWSQGSPSQYVVPTNRPWWWLEHAGAVFTCLVLPYVLPYEIHRFPWHPEIHESPTISPQARLLCSSVGPCKYCQVDSKSLYGGRAFPNFKPKISATTRCSSLHQPMLSEIFTHHLRKNTAGEGDCDAFDKSRFWFQVQSPAKKD